MKKVLILMFLIASVVFGRTLITYQDFEGSQFPPQGWTSYGWERAGTSNHWASMFIPQGMNNCYLVVYTDSGSTSIIYPTYDWKDYTVYRDTIVGCFVDFYYQNDYLSFNNLHIRSHYKIEFKAKKEGGEWPTGYVQLDNVRITECATEVEPSSLGKVKVLFK